MEQTEITKSREKLIEILHDPKKTVTNILFPNDKTVYVKWKYIEAVETSCGYTNVVFAFYVTAYGRLMLYNVMEKLGKNIMYCDTDSIIFVSREGEYEPETGDSLGEW